MLSQTVQFLSRFTFLAAGGGIETGVLHVTPSSIERFTKTVGTATLAVSGMDEINQVLCFAS